MTLASLSPARLLANRKAYMMLLVLHGLVVIATMWGSRNMLLSDSGSYLALANGILNGNYSMWWPLGDEWPDTFRSPGYPLFMAGVMKAFGTWKAVFAINFLLYWMSLAIALRLLERMDGRLLVRSVFLLLMLPMVNVPFYIMQVYTEIPVLAAVMISLSVLSRPGPWSLTTAIMLGLLFGFVQQCKPIFLLFPPLVSICVLLIQRRSMDIRGHLVMLFTFGISLLPYGFWNLRHHGIFRLTPLEGGAGYMHFGIWAGKFPGYTDPFHLHNFAGDEVFRFVPEHDVPLYISAYEKEWGEVKAVTDPLLTRNDSLMLSSRDDMPYNAQSTYNMRYTVTREAILGEMALRQMLDDPWYTVRYKIYSAVRLWVVGIQRGDYLQAPFIGKLKLLFGPIVTGVVFLLFLVLVPIAYRCRVLVLGNTWPHMLFLGYFGLLHVPFTIQSRYTVPVRMIMLMLVATALAGLLFKERHATEGGNGLQLGSKASS